MLISRKVEYRGDSLAYQELVHSKGTLTYTIGGDIEIVCNGQSFYTDAAEGLFSFLQIVPEWTIRNGVLEAVISGVYVPLPNIVWAYFYGFQKKTYDPRRKLLSINRCLADHGIVVECLTQSKQDNHLTELAAVPADMRGMLSSLRKRIDYPCYFEVVHNYYKFDNYLVKCGVYRSGYVKKFRFSDLSEYDESIRFFACLREFLDVVKGKSLLAAGVNDERRMSPGRRQRMLKEPFGNYIAYEEGALKDISGKLGVKIKKAHLEEEAHGKAITSRD